MIPRLKPTLGWRELAALVRPAAADAVPRFEAAFAQLARQKHAIAFPYGRTGLWALLQAMGLEGREVICPAYTCVVVPHAIVHAGATPVFVDSNARDFNMNLDLARKAVTPRTGAIIATSIFGHPVNLAALEGFRRDFPAVRVIHDGAHSFFAEDAGRPVHLAADANIVGLNISKLMTSIFGGMTTTDDDALADALRQVRDRLVAPPGRRKGFKRRLYLGAIPIAFSGPVYGFVNRLERAGLLRRFVKYFDEATIDMPADFRIGMTGVEAEVGRIQTDRYPDIIAHRRSIAGVYDEEFRSVPGVTRPPLGAGATWSHYVVRVDDRDRIHADLLRRGIQLGVLIDYSIPDLKAYRGSAGDRFDCPTSRSFVPRVLNLPLAVSPLQARWIVSKLRETIGVPIARTRAA